ncbi:membrane protein [Jannaschia pagri]|uniref:Membrane protein n=1 Tax=Jannaschia pagri TaxID=2829797 RepID=A0ABQ4NL11_9RHOB|nr:MULTISPECIES: MBL fold metallo-hydrolase [unclassified Jannaschia]GIT91088.1 membrane protein [Jannaschia sp. AI_61]GIT94920.1 membrane protein [Jannaschia sp. AI_62]
MKRRRFLSIAGLTGLLGAAACAIQRTGSANPYYSGPPSDHFDGTRFFNPGGTDPKGFGDLLKWQLGGDRADWPDSVGITQTAPSERVSDLQVTMIGHASVLIQVAGLNLLTDPVWSQRASPFSFAGPARVTAPGVAFDALPPIDAVLISHNHYDHLDVATLRRLHDRFAMPVLTPLGNDALLRDEIPGIDARAGDWGEVLELPDLRVRLLPCHHWSARGTRDRSMALWASFVLETPAGKILHIGDTGYDQGRPYTAAAAHGPYRLAILPIGAYAPRWFMRDQHQNPEEAVAGLIASGAKWGLAHHWGTFQLTNEARDEPPARLSAALAAEDLPLDVFRALPPGATWNVPR